MRIIGIDHIVMTVRNLEETISFYKRLGFEAREFGKARWALHFGQQKINLHQEGSEFSPHAERPRPGSLDLCFLVEGPIQLEVEIEEGPVRRTGALGAIESVYVRDPDGNLLEFSVLV